MIQRVRQEIGEPSIAGQIGTQQGTWSDTQIIGYLNDAQHLLERDARIQAPPTIINLVAGQNVYDLPSDCLDYGVRKIQWTSGTRTYEVPAAGIDRWAELSDLNSLDPQKRDIPTYGAIYAVWAGQIYLFPTPTLDGDFLTVWYYKKVPDMVNLTDTSLIPERFHIALVKYAIAQCQAAVEESQLQMIAMQEFERLAAQLERERAVETRDRPARVRLRV
jgi:hypothetical protein